MCAIMEYSGRWMKIHLELELTSGGIARDHIATPALPPASMTAGKLNGGAGAVSVEPGISGGAALNFRLTNSYVAKYLYHVSAAI